MLAVAASLTLLPATKANGQNRGENQISLATNQIKPTGDYVTVDFDLDLRNYPISASRQLVLTPVISDGNGNVHELPQMIVNGRRRDNLYRRMERINRTQEDGTVYRVVRIKGNEPGEVVNYRTQIPFQRWMRNASVTLNMDLCGCGGENENTSRRIVAQRIDFPAAPVFDFAYTPNVTFIQPPREDVKIRHESGTAHITFGQGQSAIQADIGNNRAELEKIAASLNYVQGEPTAEIASITIKAYASPEGTWHSNLALSQRRASALRSYVGQFYGIAPRMIRAEGMGEDWAGLDSLVSNWTTLPDREAVLAIIRGTDVFDGRERKLMNLSGGSTYRIMLNDLFPMLRRSDYTIEYSVPSFTIEKSKELIQSRPNMLSLEEMYLIANTYEKGSDAFNEVFATAVHLFPNDRIANLNAAGALLLAGDAARAETILTPYADDPQAWNNLGAAMMKLNRLDEAESYLIRARSAGSAEAAANLEILRQLLEAIKEHEDRQAEYERYL